MGGALRLGHPRRMTPALPIGASELVQYELELDRLRGVRADDLPDRMRRARGFVGADAAEEIAQIQGDRAVIDARIAWLEDLLRAATVLPEGPADGVATLGCAVEVEYERTGRRASYWLSGIASGADALDGGQALQRGPALCSGPLTPRRSRSCRPSSPLFPPPPSRPNG